MLETVTAEKLLASFTMEDYTVVLINLAAYVAGFLIHILHKLQKEQLTLFQFWLTHRTNTIASIIALTTTFIAMAIMSPDAPLYAFFTTAYMGDSLINKTITPSIDRTRGVVGTTANEGFAAIFAISCLFVLVIMGLQYITPLI